MFWRFLLISIVVFIVYRAVRRRLLPFFRQGEVRGGGHDVIHKGEMVQDPICGIYVPREGSVSLMEGGREHFFCSDKCRDQFQSHGESGS